MAKRFKLKVQADMQVKSDAAEVMRGEQQRRVSSLVSNAFLLMSTSCSTKHSTHTLLLRRLIR